MAAVKPTILVVDDEENILEVIAMLLERGGFEVFTAGAPPEALEMMKARRPDLIISDVNMPGMDGHAFFRAVQANAQFCTIPFLFLTARGGKEDMMAGKEMGVDDYLVKPLTGEELLASVRGKLKRVQAREAEAREHVEGLKREILNVLSHEFVTPLVSIKGTTDLLLSEDVKFDESELRNFLQSIRKGGDRLGRLVEDFLLSAKLQAGTLEQEAQLLHMPFDLVAVVRACADRIGRSAREKGLAIELDAPTSSLEIDAWEEHIKGILERLLDNAVKYSSPGAGPISIAVSTREGKAAVEIRDHGVGIPEAQLADIFRPFHQVNRKATEQQGPGLGLSLALGMARANGGELSGSSRPDDGSTFVLSLPLKEA